MKTLYSLCRVISPKFLVQAAIPGTFRLAEIQFPSAGQSSVPLIEQISGTIESGSNKPGREPIGRRPGNPATAVAWQVSNGEGGRAGRAKLSWN